MDEWHARGNSAILVCIYMYIYIYIYRFRRLAWKACLEVMLGRLTHVAHVFQSDTLRQGRCLHVLFPAHSQLSFVTMHCPLARGRCCITQKSSHSPLLPSCLLPVQLFSCGRWWRRCGHACRQDSQARWRSHMSDAWHASTQMRIPPDPVFQWSGLHRRGLLQFWAG